jgi:hypothetical protein
LSCLRHSAWAGGPNCILRKISMTWISHWVIDFIEYNYYTENLTECSVLSIEQVPVGADKENPMDTFVDWCGHFEKCRWFSTENSKNSNSSTGNQIIALE